MAKIPLPQYFFCFLPNKQNKSFKEKMWINGADHRSSTTSLWSTGTDLEYPVTGFYVININYPKRVEQNRQQSSLPFGGR